MAYVCYLLFLVTLVTHLRRATRCVPWYPGAKCRGSGCGDIPALGMGLRSRVQWKSRLPKFLWHTAFITLHLNPKYKKISEDIRSIAFTPCSRAQQITTSLGILAREQLLPDSYTSKLNIERISDDWRSQSRTYSVPWGSLPKVRSSKAPAEGWHDGGWPHPLSGPVLPGLGQGATCHVIQVHLQVVLGGPMAAIVGNDVRMPQWDPASGATSLLSAVLLASVGMMILQNLDPFSESGKTKSPETTHEVNLILQLHLSDENENFQSNHPRSCLTFSLSLSLSPSSIWPYLNETHAALVPSVSHRAGAEHQCKLPSRASQSQLYKLKPFPCLPAPWNFCARDSQWNVTESNQITDDVCTIIVYLDMLVWDEMAWDGIVWSGVVCDGCGEGYRKALVLHSDDHSSLVVHCFEHTTKWAWVWARGVFTAVDISPLHSWPTVFKHIHHAHHAHHLYVSHDSMMVWDCVDLGSPPWPMLSPRWRDAGSNFISRAGFSSFGPCTCDDHTAVDITNHWASAICFIHMRITHTHVYIYICVDMHAQINKSINQ